MELQGIRALSVGFCLFWSLSLVMLYGQTECTRFSPFRETMLDSNIPSNEVKALKRDNLT